MAFGDIETPPTPPDILFFHILPRLPGKSVYRFLCVCKQWQSFLTTPIFAKMHHHHHHELLIALSTTTPCKFSTIDLEAPQDGLTVGRPLPFELSHENVSIVASVHGLVCLRMIKKRDIILWNPLTGEHKTVYGPNNEECYMTATRLFGMSYSCNDYKLLLVTMNSNVYIYSLKSDSWRKVKTTQEDRGLFSSYNQDLVMPPYVLLNEKMYFVTTKQKQIFLMENFIIIIRFDFKTEKWRKIASPCIGNDLWKTCVSFMVVRGCIHLYVRYCLENYDGRFVSELWRMDGDGDGDWTKVVNTYDRPYSFPPWYILCPLHLMKNGHWIMIDEIIYNIYETDQEMHTKKEVYPRTIIIAPARKYTETLEINMFDYSTLRS